MPFPIPGQPGSGPFPNPFKRGDKPTQPTPIVPGQTPAPGAPATPIQPANKSFAPPPPPPQMQQQPSMTPGLLGALTGSLAFNRSTQTPDTIPTPGIPTRPAVQPTPPPPPPAPTAPPPPPVYYNPYTGETIGGPGAGAPTPPTGTPPPTTQPPTTQPPAGTPPPTTPFDPSQLWGKLAGGIQVPDWARQGITAAYGANLDRGAMRRAADGSWEILVNKLPTQDDPSNSAWVKFDQNNAQHMNDANMFNRYGVGWSKGALASGGHHGDQRDALAAMLGHEPTDQEQYDYEYSPGMWAQLQNWKKANGWDTPGGTGPARNPNGDVPYKPVPTPGQGPPPKTPETGRDTPPPARGGGHGKPNPHGQPPVAGARWSDNQHGWVVEKPPHSGHWVPYQAAGTQQPDHGKPPTPGARWSDNQNGWVVESPPHSGHWVPYRASNQRSAPLSGKGLGGDDGPRPRGPGGGSNPPPTGGGQQAPPPTGGGQQAPPPTGGDNPPDRPFGDDSPTLPPKGGPARDPKVPVPGARWSANQGAWVKKNAVGNWVPVDQKGNFLSHGNPPVAGARWSDNQQTWVVKKGTSWVPYTPPRT